jgi:Na+-translocating ferredoxin:NAD+ oxidoreductase RnfD subunit
MGWSKKMWNYWKGNLEKNVERISIAIGSFIIGIFVMVPLPIEWKGPVVILSTLIIMSIFGKNGNGHAEEKTEE